MSATCYLLAPSPGEVLVPQTVPAESTDCIFGVVLLLKSVQVLITADKMAESGFQQD